MKMSAGALIIHQTQILIVKPSYHDYWLPPGGGVELGESPRGACMREIEEEIGLQINPGRLLCVDFVPRGTPIGRNDQKRNTSEDEIVFMFFGGYLTTQQLQRIHLAEGELTEFRYCSLQDAIPLFPNYLRSRMPRCLDALEQKTAYYLENGQIISSDTDSSPQIT